MVDHIEKQTVIVMVMLGNWTEIFSESNVYLTLKHKKGLHIPTKETTSLTL
jgi:hypothetical protein